MRSLFLSLSNHHLVSKFACIIIGFYIWHTVHQYINITKSLTVPLLFYNTQTDIIQAPDYLKIYVSGTPRAMHNLLREDMAVHIDAKSLPYDKQTPLIINSHNLFLPNSIKLLSYTIPIVARLSSSE